MPVNASRLIRKMRGGAQAHLIEADDGNFYVVKFRNNPQHRRILINERIASSFLDYLQISAPPTAVIRISPEFLAGNPETYLQLGTRRLEVSPGWHFGSRYPGDPARTAVYDFIPDALLEKVMNLPDFLGVFVFDKWVANADARQSIFFRARLREASAPVGAGARLGFIAHMMDHGFVFDGPHWNFVDSPLQGLYFRPDVYRRVRSLDDFQPWLDRVLHFPEDAVDHALKQIPAGWFDCDEAELEKLLVRLMARRRRVPGLIEESRHGRTNPFPNWK
jgi:hypothetical protein